MNLLGFTIDFEWKPDYTALVISYAYVFSIIALGEVLRRLGNRPLAFTRKFIHVGVGMWVVGTALLFGLAWALAWLVRRRSERSSDDPQHAADAT